jgi:hypothetical protein
VAVGFDRSDVDKERIGLRRMSDEQFNARRAPRGLHVFACKYLEVSAAPIVARRMIRCGWVDKTEALCARC